MEQRLYNLEGAQEYLGMTRSQWDKTEAAKYLTKIRPPGCQRFLFDRCDLDALADTMKAASERPEKELEEWDNTKASSRGVKSGGRIRRSKVIDFENLAERLTKEKP